MMEPNQSKPSHPLNPLLSSPKKTLFSFIVLGMLALFMVGCPTRTPRPRQGIRIQCAKKNARVFVDGHFLGRGRRVFGRIVSLPPGRHLIEVRLDGHYARYREVRVLRGRVHLLPLSIQRELFWKKRRLRPKNPKSSVTTTNPTDENKK